MRLTNTFRRKCAMALLFLMLIDVCQPLTAFALTNGPAQPEVQGFKPIEATNMVDLFSGDFNYNLPLFEIDGYPVNMSYSSNSRMEDEASWVGLGWTLNPGSINREVRGFPDDFKDEDITKKYNLKKDVTIGMNYGFDAELFGIKGLRAGFGRGIFWNNKKGYGTQTSASLGGSLGQVNATYNTQSGLDIGVNIGILSVGNSNTLSLNAGTNINSRQGIKAVDFGLTAKSSISRVLSISKSAQFDLGGFTYFPTNAMPVNNTSFSFHGRLGLEIKPLHPAANLDGYVTVQALGVKEQTQKAFGYLYHKEGQAVPTNLLDANRDNQLVFRDNLPNLPISYGTYDNFTVAGQGVGGQFKLYKNDVGVLHNGYATNNSMSGKYGVEIGIGDIVHAGSDITVTKVESKSQAWIANNKARGKMAFTDHDSLYERAYLKDVSEKMIDDTVFTTAIGGTNPTFVRMSVEKTNAVAEEALQHERNKVSVGSYAMAKTMKKIGRAKRGSTMSYLTEGEAIKLGLDTFIRSYDFNTLYLNNNTCPMPTAVGSVGKSHHIREMTINKPDGSRYIFGIPTYNVRQKEVSFSVNQNTQTLDGQAYITYAGTDTTTNNANGRDNFLENQTIPAHATGYLLTAVLSDDYVDVQQDGITDDDLGNAVKFNYSKQPNLYKWRTPYAANKARLMQGMKTDKLDDKASYVYGEKEIWYLHSIESRNMVAQFYVSGSDAANRRRDGFGVAGEQGGIDSSFAQGLRKLDSIKIYSKSDLLKNGANAIPIKQVNFEYNYDLCQKSLNSSFVGVGGMQGKLTLKKVYFTFGNNGKGKLNAYKFNYRVKHGTSGPLFNYDSLKIDRWGFLKEHPANYPSYVDFPYSVQDSTLANSYAGAWNMDTIFLPSGGRILVDYESDDYAYIQDKRAGQMFLIKGFAQDTSAVNFNVTSPNAKSLYLLPSIPFGNPVNSKFIVIDAANYASLLNTSNPKREAVKLFFEDVKDLYFKVKVQLTPDPKTMEFVTGYAACDTNLVHYNGATKNLFVPIKAITEGKLTVNPITLAAFQTLRLNLPDVAYDFAGRSDNVNNPDKAGMAKILGGLIGFGNAVADMISGYTRNRVTAQWAKTVDLTSSWIRLANPTYKKFGGGSRVKKISVFDNWTIANGGGESNYTQSFSYTTDLNGKTISSGVAAYEPLLGGDEISLKQPMTYQEKNKLAPNNSFFSETPIGESLFPSGSVGYSEVRVESVYPNVKRSGTGFTLNKYYTAKDFPIITDFTNIVAGTVSVKPDKSVKGIISKLFKFNVVEQRGVSQGFSIEVNDMHGKPKEEGVYNQQGALISATNYYYKVDDSTAPTLHLNNDVQTIYPDGSIKTQKMGIETDIWQEMHEEYTKTSTNGVAANVDAFRIFIFPIVIPIILPVLQNENKGLRTAVTTKLIRRMGMLDKVVKTVDGSTLATNNLLYDVETGDVLLTQTENEFNDPIYNFNYPAHWAYDGMGPSYKNIGSIFKGVSFTSTGAFDNATMPYPEAYFATGDEVSLFNEATQTYLTERYYLVAPNNLAFSICDRNGLPFTEGGKFTLKVLRSGRRNQASASIGSFTSLASPTNAVGNQLQIDATKKVIQSDAKVFADYWRARCPKTRSLTDPTVDSFALPQFSNPYVMGLLGNWRGRETYVNFTTRNQTDVPTATDIRRDGTIPNYSPFWVFNTGIGWGAAGKTHPTWVRSDQMEMYDARGNEIESRDANDIKSSAAYGYNGTQVVAVTSNAEHKEMTFDSFEDYAFKNACGGDSSYRYDKNIRFFDPLASAEKGSLDWAIIDNQSHTGRHALWMGAGGTFKAGTLLEWDFCPPCTNCGPNGSTSTEALNSSGGGISCLECLPIFSLYGTKRYVISYWIATDSSLRCNSIPNPNIDITVFATGAPVPLKKVSTSPVIDGWQKVEVLFTTPSGNGANLAFQLSNQSGGSAYFDDIRILPFNAKMKSFTYDIYSRRLMAELDENNYATFYEYDDEGILVRIKRETETGIQTVKEARNYLKPNN
jgi:hypothetical protein